MFSRYSSFVLDNLRIGDTLERGVLVDRHLFRVVQRKENAAFDRLGRRIELPARIAVLEHHRRIDIRIAVVILLLHAAQLQQLTPCRNRQLQDHHRIVCLVTKRNAFPLVLFGNVLAVLSVLNTFPHQVQVRAVLKDRTDNEVPLLERTQSRHLTRHESVPLRIPSTAVAKLARVSSLLRHDIQLGVR